MVVLDIGTHFHGDRIRLTKQLFGVCRLVAMLVFLIRITWKNGPQAGDQHHQAQKEADNPKAFDRAQVQG